MKGVRNRTRESIVGNILVSGLIYMETTANVGGFPIDFSKSQLSRFGLKTQISGSSYNVAKALRTLGNDVRLLSIIGRDALGEALRNMLERDGIPPDHVLSIEEHTLQSLVLHDGNGTHHSSVDLKGLQDLTIPDDRFTDARKGCSLFALCDMSFSKEMLRKVRKSGIPIAVNLPVVADLNDEHHADFVSISDVLFMSGEGLPCSPEQWVRYVRDRFAPEIVVVSLGSQGVLLWVKRDNFIERIAGVQTREVVSTEGADEALFSCFIHSLVSNGDPYDSLEKALIFTSHKVGEAGRDRGFLDEAGLDELQERVRRDSTI